MLNGTRKQSSILAPYPAFQAHAQAESLDELNANLKEVLELCLEEYKDELDDVPTCVGLQQIEVAA